MRGVEESTYESEKVRESFRDFKSGLERWIDIVRYAAQATILG
jgi:hypothetical protein